MDTHFRCISNVGETEGARQPFSQAAGGAWTHGESAAGTPSWTSTEYPPLPRDFSSRHRRSPGRLFSSPLTA